jgi:hypothetical protein
VWQGFINISESFSYKDSISILATIRKEDLKDSLNVLGYLKDNLNVIIIFV